MHILASRYGNLWIIQAREGRTLMLVSSAYHTPTIQKEKHQSLLADYLPHFSIDYQNKIGRFRRWQDAQLSLLGRILLLKGMEKMDLSPVVPKFGYTKYEKPYLEGGGVKFNISHSGKLVVCALSLQQEIGIDVESMGDINVEDYKPQMTDSEWRKIMLSDHKLHAFYRYWTEKEAVLKAHGQGLSLPLKSFEVERGQANVKGDIFYLSFIDLDREYQCYIATNQPFSETLLDIQEISLSDL